MGNVLHQNLQISKTNVQEIVQIIPQILNIIWIASAALQIYIFDAGLIYIHVKNQLSYNTFRRRPDPIYWIYRYPPLGGLAANEAIVTDCVMQLKSRLNSP